MKRSLVFGLLATITAFGAFTQSGEAYYAGAVSDGGTIKGKVVFNDTRPPMKKVIPTKSQEVCGGIHEEPQIVLAEDGGVEQAVVFLKDVKAGKPWNAAASTTKLDNLGCKYVPRVQVAPKGSALEIVNSDPILHTVHGFLGANTLFNKALWKAKADNEPLDTPGLVRVDCDVHGWMRAWVYVVDNPYYAMTAKDGSFTLTDVPPGDYTLVSWHEYTGAVEIPVTVKAKESVSITAEVKKGESQSVVQILQTPPQG